MTHEETRMILATLKAAYPQAYQRMTVEDAKIMINLWQEMLDHPYQLVAAAVKTIIASDRSGRPPTIGQVNDKIAQLTAGRQMTEGEAWVCVQAALRTSTNNCEAEFAKLPPRVQRLVGSPNQLREWAVMDSSEVQTVVASNFQRSYRARAASDREYEALPESIKTMVTGLLPSMDQAEQRDFESLRADAIKQLEAAT